MAREECYSSSGLREAWTTDNGQYLRKANSCLPTMEQNHPPFRLTHAHPLPTHPTFPGIGTASRGLGEGLGRAHYPGGRKHSYGYCGGASWYFPEAQGVCAGGQAGVGDVRGHDFVIQQGGDAKGGGPTIDWWVGCGGVPELFWESGMWIGERGEDEEDGGMRLCECVVSIHHLFYFLAAVARMKRIRH